MTSKSQQISCTVLNRIKLPPRVDLLMWRENEMSSSESFISMLSVATFSLGSPLLRITWQSWPEWPSTLTLSQFCPGCCYFRGIRENVIQWPSFWDHLTKDQNTIPLSPIRKHKWDASSETFFMPSALKGLYCSLLLLTLLPPAMVSCTNHNPPPPESKEKGPSPSAATNKKAGNLITHLRNEGMIMTDGFLRHFQRSDSHLSFSLTEQGIGPWQIGLPVTL